VGIFSHGHNDFTKDTGGSLNEIDMPVGHGVKAAGVDGCWAQGILSKEVESRKKRVESNLRIPIRP